MTKLLSDTISFLRFPLCCAIVLHHSGVPGRGRTNDSILYIEPTISKFMGSEITCLSVSLFFLISGLLFFNNIEGFGIIRGGG